MRGGEGWRGERGKGEEKRRGERNGQEKESDGRESDKELTGKMLREQNGQYLHRSIVFFWNWFRFDVRLDIAIKIILKKSFKGVYTKKKTVKEMEVRYKEAPIHYHLYRNIYSEHTLVILFYND